MELKKEQIDSIYRLIEKARDSGKIKKGTNEVTKSVEKGESKLVIIAEDVNPREIVMHIPMLCEEKKIPLVWVPTKAELGASAGLTAQASSVAIVDAGEAKKLLLRVISDFQRKAPKPEVETPKEEPKQEEKPKETPKAEEKPVEKPKETPKEEKKPEEPKQEKSKEEPKKEDTSKKEEKPAEEKAPEPEKKENPKKKQPKEKKTSKEPVKDETKKKAKSE